MGEKGRELGGKGEGTGGKGGGNWEWGTPLSTPSIRTIAKARGLSPRTGGQPMV